MDSMDMDNSGSLFAVLMAFKVQPRSRGLVRGEHAMIVINKFARKWQERKRGNGKWEAGSHAVDFENDCICNLVCLGRIHSQKDVN